MKVALDHITIRTHQLSKTKDFLIDLFELEEGSRPALIQRIPGYWLYADGQLKNLKVGVITLLKVCV